jgi:hypothetical protein
MKNGRQEKRQAERREEEKARHPSSHISHSRLSILTCSERIRSRDACACTLVGGRLLYLCYGGCLKAKPLSTMKVIAAICLLMCSVRGFQQNPSSITPPTRRQTLRTKTSTTQSRTTQQISLFSSTQANDSKPRNKRRSNRQYNKKKKRRRELGGGKELKNPDEVITWRCYGIDVYPDDLGPSLNIDKRREKRDKSNIPSERSYLTPPVISSLLSRLRIKTSPEEATDGLPPILKDARVVRRSLDARRRKGSDPKYTYVIDIDLTRQAARKLGLTQQSGKMEVLDNKKLIGQVDDSANNAEDSIKTKPRIIIVGAGPAGLFCALSLASSGLCTPILLERGLPVEARGKSIGALIHRRSVDPESNFSFGEGGAGTWSDGKLTTRIGRNSGKCNSAMIGLSLICSICLRVTKFLSNQNRFAMYWKHL